MTLRRAAGCAGSFALAVVLLATGPATAITISDSSVSPASVVTVGTVITITATITSDSTNLGKLRANQTLLALCEPSGTAYGMDGDYAIYPDDTDLVMYPSASSTMIDFNYSSGVDQAVCWTFTAKGVGVVNFSLMGDDDASETMEGCSDPAGCGYSTTIYNASTCDFVTVTIVEPEIGVTLYVDPDGAESVYSVAPENKTYITTRDEVWVIATMTNSGAQAYYVDPACIPDDMWTFTPNPDFMLSASRTPAGPVLLSSGGGSQTFTWKYVVDRSEYFKGCIASVEYGWKVREGVDLVGKWNKNSLNVERNPLTFVTNSTDWVVRGEEISATAYMTNSSPRALVFDPSATLYMEVGATPLVELLASPVVSATLTMGPGATIPLVWTYSATASGFQYFNGALLYNNTLCPSGILDVTQIMAPIPFAMELNLNKSEVNTYETYLGVLSVFNSDTAENYIDALTIEPMPFGWAPNPCATCFQSNECPVLPCTVPASTTAYFTWTFTGGLCGVMDWSGTLTGHDDVESFSRPYWSDDVSVRSRANYVLDAGFTSSTVLETQNFEVVLYVTPFGMNDAVDFSVTLTAHTSAGATILEVTPAVIPVSMTGCGVCVTSPCPAKTLAFTWVYQAVSRGTKGDPDLDAGKVWFTFTVSGIDEYDSTPVEEPPFTIPMTYALQILRPSVISVSVFTAQGSTAGCPVNVIGVVAADGDTKISSFTLSLTGESVCSGTPDVALYSIPAATGTLGTGGDFFTWTFSPTAAGDLRFTVSVTGIESGLGLYSEAEDTTSECYQISPPLVSVTIWHDVGGGVKTTAPGQYFNVYMRARNDGDVPVYPVDVCAAPASMTCTGGSCSSTILGGVLLTNTVFADVSGGFLGCSEKIFVWRMTTTDTGCAAFSVSITGLDSDSGSPIYASGATTCLSIVERPDLLVRIASVPATVMPGRNFEVVMEVENPGSTKVQAWSNPPVFLPVSGVSYQEMNLKFPVNPGETKRITYAFTASPNASTGARGLSLSASPISATDITDPTGKLVTVSTNTAPYPFTIIPAETTLSLLRNPFHPLKGGLPIHFTVPEAGKVVVKVYSITGELVKTILDEHREAGDYTIVWDGKNADSQTIAAGIYVLRFESKGLKTTKKLAVIK